MKIESNAGPGGNVISLFTTPIVLKIQGIVMLIRYVLTWLTVPEYWRAIFRMEVIKNNFVYFLYALQRLGSMVWVSTRSPKTRRSVQSKWKNWKIFADRRRPPEP